MIPNIYGFMGLIPLGFFVAEIPFLAFFALHRERKRCGQVGSIPGSSQIEVTYAYQVLDVSPKVFLAKIPFSETFARI